MGPRAALEVASKDNTKLQNTHMQGKCHKKRTNKVWRVQEGEDINSVMGWRKGS